MTVILVAGAINTDFEATMQRAPDAGETITASEFAVFAGGKGANQAVSAARNDMRVAMVGAVGDDDIGAARRADLEAAGIDTAWVAVDSSSTSGVALIFVEGSGENRIAYVPGATSRVARNWATQAFSAVEPDLVLAPNELAPDVLRELFEGAQKSGTPVVFNVAPYSEAAADLVKAADVVVLNATEFRDLTGLAFDGGDNVAAILDAIGIGRAVITRGKDGAVVVEGGSAHDVPAPVVEVVDSTGAGDAFCGALAAALAGGDSLLEATTLGVYAGSLACTVKGAQPSSPTLAAIRRARDRSG
jgi:ribokinase